MEHNRYQVIYKGEFLEGSDREKAYRIAAVLLSVSETKVRQLLNGQRMVLKKGLDETTARGMCTALQQAGIRVALGVPRDQLTDAGQGFPTVHPGHHDIQDDKVGLPRIDLLQSINPVRGKDDPEFPFVECFLNQAQ